MINNDNFSHNTHNQFILMPAMVIQLFPMKTLTMLRKRKRNGGGENIM